MDLKEIREHLDRLDSAIVYLIAERVSYMPRIAKYKNKHNIERYHPKREAEIIEAKRKVAEDLGISPELVEDIFKRLIEESHKIEKKIMGK